MGKYSSVSPSAAAASVIGRYRPDVDGMRAIAVLVVLAFHLGIESIGGGFVGVDVFFVISGYVIVRQIAGRIGDGSFSFREFFIRRIRRICPALFVVVGITLVAAHILMSPEEYAQAAGSALSAIFFGSNFYFFDRVGYFAADAEQQPLLHTWSLGIEAQFYVVVPLVLVGLHRLLRLRVGTSLILITIASLAYCIGATALSEKHGFYIPLARFWELGVGGLLAVVEGRVRLSRGLANLIAVGGGAAVAAAVLLYNSDTIFPGAFALLPVLGTAALILSGSRPDSAVASLLATRPMVWTGERSYSIYLVHWPLIAFTSLVVARPLALTEQLTIAAATMLLSALLYVAVEKPLRAGRGAVRPVPALATVAGLAVLASAGSAAVLHGNGLPSRLAPEAAAVLVSGLEEHERGKQGCVPQPDWMANSVGKRLRICKFNSERAETDFVLWGDSHAGMLYVTLGEEVAAAGRSLVVVTLAGCPPMIGVAVSGRKNAACAQVAYDMLDAVEREKPVAVIVATRWANLASDVRAPGDGGRPRIMRDTEGGSAVLSLADALARSVERMRERGSTLVAVGPVPEIDFDVPTTMMRSLNGLGSVPEVTRQGFDIRQKQVFAAFESLQQRGFDLPVVWPHEILCSDGSCRVADGTTPLYRDNDHLNYFGSRLVTRPVAAMLRELAAGDGRIAAR